MTVLLYTSQLRLPTRPEEFLATLERVYSVHHCYGTPSDAGFRYDMHSAGYQGKQDGFKVTYAHIFCRPEQIKAEMADSLEALERVHDGRLCYGPPIESVLFYGMHSTDYQVRQDNFKISDGQGTSLLGPATHHLV